MEPMGATPRIFISYSHADEAWKDRIVSQLGVLEHEGLLSVWEDRQIAGGDDWLPAIEAAINSCGVALLLISAPFLTSKFILGTEVPALLQRREQEGVRVIPVILKSCAWTRVGWLQSIQARPKDGKPLNGMRAHKVDAALAALAGEIADLLARTPDPTKPNGPHVIPPDKKNTQLDGYVNPCYPSRSPLPYSHCAVNLFGRTSELQELDDAWDNPDIRVFVLVAWGGVGKTSLVKKWMDQLSKQAWRGAKRVFEWSFYNQGVSEQSETPYDDFISDALKCFGDDAMAGSSATLRDKAARLARLVGQDRNLVVLDGLEPLQHPPMGNSLSGRIKDRDLANLLSELARHNPGLCIVTSRYRISDLESFSPLAYQKKLDNLSEQAGATLLYSQGVKVYGDKALRDDDPELCQASREMNGHALALKILGSYLARFHGGDVRRRDRVELAQADPLYKTNLADKDKEHGHAFKAMAAYEKHLAESGDHGQRQLALLKLLGLFDRPADPGCLGTLRQAPAILGLTELLFRNQRRKQTPLNDVDWKSLVADLTTAGLVQASPYVPKKTSGYDQDTAQRRMESLSRNVDFPLAPPQPFPSPSFSPDAMVLDAHPLLREYFAQRLRKDNTKAWQEGHRRLYEHLKASVSYWPEGEACLQPLYQAVAHGCHAGLYMEAVVEVYDKRIARREGYSTLKLGLFSTNMSALLHLLSESEKMRVQREDWPGAARQRALSYTKRSDDAELQITSRTTLANALHQDDQQSKALELFREAERLLAKQTKLEYELSAKWRAWLFAEVGFNLHALGRLGEALEAYSESEKMRVQREDWPGAAHSTGNLSEAELALGLVGAAVHSAQRALSYAERSDDAELQITSRTTLANALHQDGQQGKALELFREAERLQAEHTKHEYELLCRLPGFSYCDLLLAGAECTAWRAFFSSPLGKGTVGKRRSSYSDATPANGPGLAACRAVAKRAAQTLRIAEENKWLLSVALDRLTLARAALYEVLLKGRGTAAALAKARGCMDVAVNDLRKAEQQQYLPVGLITRAWLYCCSGMNRDAAQVDLDEAQDIAERNEMRLVQADIHLHRARLFRDKAELKKARDLIEQCDYWRRKEELEDAEAAARGWQPA